MTADAIGTTPSNITRSRFDASILNPQSGERNIKVHVYNADERAGNQVAVRS